jgi:hypothetical protein
MLPLLLLLLLLLLLHAISRRVSSTWYEKRNALERRPVRPGRCRPFLSSSLFAALHSALGNKCERSGA